ALRAPVTRGADDLLPRQGGQRQAERQGADPVHRCPAPGADALVVSDALIATPMVPMLLHGHIPDASRSAEAWCRAVLRSHAGATVFSYSLRSPGRMVTHHCVQANEQNTHASDQSDLSAFPAGSKR